MLKRRSEITKDNTLKEYIEQLEIRNELQKNYSEVIQNMLQYLDDHNGELIEEVLTVL